MELFLPATKAHYDVTMAALLNLIFRGNGTLSTNTSYTLIIHGMQYNSYNGVMTSTGTDFTKLEPSLIQALYGLFAHS